MYFDAQKTTYFDVRKIVVNGHLTPGNDDLTTDSEEESLEEESSEEESSESCLKIFNL